ncbi:MAG: hypothetical protein V4543_15645 [Bacteroidota bacterium]
MEFIFTFFGALSENPHYIEHQQAYLDSVFPLAGLFLTLFGIVLPLGYYLAGRFTSALSTRGIWFCFWALAGLLSAWFSLKIAQAAVFLEGQLDPDGFMLSFFFIQLGYTLLVFFIVSLPARRFSIHSKYVPL